MPQRVRVKIEGLREPADAVRIADLGADMIGLVFAPSPRRVTPEQAAAVVAALPPEVTAIGVFVDAPAEEINDIVRRTGIGIVQLHGNEPPDLPGGIDRPCIKAFRVRDAGAIEEAVAWMEQARQNACLPPPLQLQRRGAETYPLKRAGQSPVSDPSVPRSPSVPPVSGIRYPVSDPSAPSVSGIRYPVSDPSAPSVSGIRYPVSVLLDAYDPRAAGGTGRRFNWQLVADARAAGKLDALGPIVLAGGLDPSCVAEAIRVVQPVAVDVASGVESAPGVKDFAKVEAFIRAVREACNTR